MQNYHKVRYYTKSDNIWAIFFTTTLDYFIWLWRIKFSRAEWITELIIELYNSYLNANKDLFYDFLITISFIIMNNCTMIAASQTGF